MSSTIDNLREIVRRCQSGQLLDDNLAHWLGASFERFLSRQCQTIEDAQGLRAPRGGVPRWRQEAKRQRDATVHNLADRFFETPPPSPQAKRMRVLAVRYGAPAWLHDRGTNELPVSYRGKSNEPSFVVKTLEVLAKTRGVSADEMAKITSDNFFNLFSKVPRPATFS